METKQGYLYCARADEYIKVGFSIKPKERLLALRTNGYTLCPQGLIRTSLKLEGQLSITRDQETAFHRQFKAERIIGTAEWYPAEGKAHTAFRSYVAKGEVPAAPSKPSIAEQVGEYGPRVQIVVDGDPLEEAIFLLEVRKLHLTIQRHRSPLSLTDAQAWSLLDRASEHLCQQL